MKYIISIFSINLLLATPALSRCAVCAVKGMSGASIAVLIIISIFIILAVANWSLKKLFNKN
tara:strand:+ start:202 stop:387 length:186 start_codon:yes stop_codon:yes gene_type:complete